MARIFGLIIVIGVLLVGGIAVWRSLHSSSVAARPDDGRLAVEIPSPSGATAVLARSDGPECRGEVTFDDAAKRNGASAANLRWSPFGRAEVGWATYWPLIAHEIGAGCSPASPAFAARLSGWQQAHGFKADGVMAPAQFEAMKQAWNSKRPYVALRGRGACPDPPSPANLATALAAESYGGKQIQLRPGALAAYRELVQAARREIPGLRDRPQMLQIFSGYRSPESDAARCASEHNCNGIVRATCSAHRTGLAMDVILGQAPGYAVDSSADANRLYMTQTDVYRWLVANAARFGFVNYPFEPWHWEWTGENLNGNGTALALLSSAKEQHLDQDRSEGRAGVAAAAGRLR
jgi:LAS superfamily LD-carboxypeptidase LdcB